MSDILNALIKDLRNIETNFFFQGSSPYAIEIADEIESIRQQFEEVRERERLLRDDVHNAVELNYSLSKRVKELEAALVKAKDVPMKYKRMEFNAQLQVENESLRQRVKDLEAVEKMRDEEIASIREKHGNCLIELDALKAGQGEPVAAWNGQYDHDGSAIEVNTSAPTIPEGWVWVPVEPTKAMIDALALAKNSTMQGYKSLLTDTEFRNMAKAMLAAAPSPYSQGDE